MSIIYKNLLISTSVVFSYLFVEWIYNQHLLVLLSYDYIDPENFQFTEMFGKAIASFGLNLIINSLFKKFYLIRFVIGLIIGYIILTFAFNYAVNAFPDDFRHSSYYSMLYRKDVINQNDKNEILKFTDNKLWYEKSLVISQFVYVLKDEQWKDFEKKVKEPITEKISKLNKNRSQYYRSYKKFDDYYEPLMNGWNKYTSAQLRYNTYKNVYKREAKAKFIQKVGLPPDLTLDEFTKKSAPEYYKVANTKLFDGSVEAHLEPIYVKNLPRKMNEKLFNIYIDNQIKRISIQIAPEVDTIRQNKQSFDSLAILVIPPISICLSLFSIVINILILIAKWSYVLLNINRINLGIYSSIILILTTSVLIVFTNMQSTLTEQDPYWSHLKEINYNEHPVLFSIFTTGLKLEPILCFNQEEPKIIKDFTNMVYPKN